MLALSVSVFILENAIPTIIGTPVADPTTLDQIFESIGWRPGLILADISNHAHLMPVSHTGIKSTIKDDMLKIRARKKPRTVCLQDEADSVRSGRW